MSSRSQILGNIRLHQPAAVQLPEVPRGIVYDDPIAQFSSVLAGVGGQTVEVAGPEALAAAVRSLPAFTAANKTVILHDSLPAGTLTLAEVEDPHELCDVDFALFAGEFGVAENAAIWFRDKSLRHRVLPFIVQHLAVALPASEMVHNMHQAYERITIEGPGFGLFMSGPSKTADIEQSLVIGAHGARSLTVFLVS